MLEYSFSFPLYYAVHYCNIIVEEFVSCFMSSVCVVFWLFQLCLSALFYEI
jgi:hypothetical protein